MRSRRTGMPAPVVRPIAVLCLLLGAGLARAQTGSDEDLMAISLEDLAKTKVVSASRHLEDARSAPSAVTVITAREITRYGWRTLGDVLNGVRGFYTSYDRNYTYLGVRGIERPGDYNSRILLMVNGHRLNDNVYESAALGTEFPLDLDLVDHIEIIRGPSSSLFGTNALFGVINVITRRPPAGVGVEISGNESSFLTRGGRLTGTYQNGQLSALLSGSLYHSAGDQNLFFPEFAGINGGIAHDLDGDRYEDVLADIQYGGWRVQSLFGSRGKDIPTASYGTNFDAPARSVDSRGYVEAGYHRSFSAVTDLEVRTYYDWYNFVEGGEYGAGAGEYESESYARAAWVGTEAVIGRQFGRQRITAGTDFEYTPEVTQKNITVGQPPQLNVTQSPWLAAVYGEAELHLIPKLTLRAGGRFDWFDDYGGTVSPRAAAIYQPNSRTSIKYIFGRAFRSPNAYEEYYSDGVFLIAPTQRLKPEHITSHEAVFEQTLRPWLLVTADAFYNNLTDLIDQVPDPASGLNHFVNVGHDRGRGFELELAATRESGLSGQASYTFANSGDQALHTSLANTPSSTLKLHGIIPASRHAFAGLEVLYTNAQTSYQGTQVPSSTQTNLTLSTKPLRGGWEFSASGYDIFNQRWYSPGGPGLTEPEIQQDGRTIRFKLTYRLPLKEKRGRP